ncbi:MAG: biotin carboxylase [Rhodothermales bacterium]|jgi:biotin carboxylase
MIWARFGSPLMDSEQRQRLMILGAGKFQVPVIEMAHKMGFETIVVSMAGAYPGFEIADSYYEIDVQDASAILDLARSKRICGILTEQTDLPVPTVAYVAEKLGLPGIGHDCALRITNKQHCRNHCSNIGFPIPEYAVCTTWEEARRAGDGIGFPLVVKPSDNQGARGVTRVDSPDELQAGFQEALAYSASKVVLLETFLPGRLIWMTGFLSDGKYRNLLLGDTDLFDIPDQFVHRQSIHPAILSTGQRQRFLDLDTHLFESLDADFAITFSQYVLNDESGDIRLVEAALRSAAGFTSSHLVPLARGINPLPLLIEHATGSRSQVNIRQADLQDRSVANTYFRLPPGTIRQIDGLEELGSLPGVAKVELAGLTVGVQAGETRDATDTYGPISCLGKSRRECEKVIDSIKNTLFVEVDGPDGIEGILWE